MAFSRYGQNIPMLHERMTRALIAARLPSKQAEPVAKALMAALGALLDWYGALFRPAPSPSTTASSPQNQPRGWMQERAITSNADGAVRLH